MVGFCQAKVLCAVQLKAKDSVGIGKCKIKPAFNYKDDKQQ